MGRASRQKRERRLGRVADPRATPPASPAPPSSASDVGQLDVLNVGSGHLSLRFDRGSAIERERARRMVTDMLRRGYALFVEVEGGELAPVREFDEAREVYIISDVPGPRSDDDEKAPAPEIRSGVGEVDVPADATCPRCDRPKHRGRCGRREVPMRSAKATAIGRSAGG